jgi:hypothetical protein
MGRAYRDARPGEHFVVTRDDDTGQDIFYVHNLARRYTVAWRGAYFEKHIRVIGAYPVGPPVHECVCECDACTSCHTYRDAFLPAPSTPN